MDKLPVIELTIDDFEKDGVDWIALVDNPAIQVNWLAFNKDEPFKYRFAIKDEEKRILAGALMIPEMNIYRNMEGREFFVKFSTEQVEKIANKFMKEGRTKMFNFMHDDKQPVNDVYIQQSFMINRDMGMNPPKGFEDLPDGTWFGFVKVDNEDIWTNYVKTGKLKGFSVEGNFSEKNKFNEQNNTFMNKIEQMFKDLSAQIKAFKFNDAANATVVTTEPAAADPNLQLAEAQLADGTKIMISGELKEGSQVTLEDGTPAPDGEHTLADGTVIAVSGGVISMVKMPEEAQEMSQEIKEKFDALTAENEKLKGELAKYTSTEAFKAFVKTQEDFNKQVFSLIEEVHKSSTEEKGRVSFKNDNLNVKLNAMKNKMQNNK